MLDIQAVDFATYVGIFTGDLPAEERPNLLPSFWSPDYNDGWNHLWPQISCDAWQSGNGGHYCNERVEELLEQARNAADEESYFSSLKGDPTDRDSRRPGGDLLRQARMADRVAT